MSDLRLVAIEARRLAVSLRWVAEDLGAPLDLDVRVLLAEDRRMAADRAAGLTVLWPPLAFSVDGRGSDLAAVAASAQWQTLRSTALLDVEELLRWAKAWDAWADAIDPEPALDLDAAIPGRTRGAAP